MIKGQVQKPLISHPAAETGQSPENTKKGVGGELRKKKRRKKRFHPLFHLVSPNIPLSLPLHHWFLMALTLSPRLRCSLSDVWLPSPKIMTCLPNLLFHCYSVKVGGGIEEKKRKENDGKSKENEQVERKKRTWMRRRRRRKRNVLSSPAFWWQEGRGVMVGGGKRR